MEIYEAENTLLFIIIVFAMILMIMLLANHIKRLLMNTILFPLPFISLTLTPLIVLHVFTVDVKLAEVVKLLMKRLF